MITISASDLLRDAGYSPSAYPGVWSKDGYGGIAYSDGDFVENRILEIISNAEDLTVLSTELRQRIDDWPTAYHLSASRANLLRPFVQKLFGANVLEIGAGCGAITRYLGECGAKVLALEGTPRRAQIARSRTRDLGNVEVVSDTFSDFTCNQKFDVVTLIGVLEYANVFMPGESPTEGMLRRALGFLKPDGILIIAIENQLGLKYFAGAPEDHFGTPMIGIEGRYGEKTAHTYGRKVLDDMLRTSGFTHREFMLPFPDYKMPICILTRRSLELPEFSASNLVCDATLKDMQLPSAPFFSQELVLPTVIENGLALDLANSFLVVASTTPPPRSNNNIIAYYYNTGRRPPFCKEILFRELDGTIRIETRSIAESLIEISQEPFTHVLRSSEPYVADGHLLSRKFVDLLKIQNTNRSDVTVFVRRYVDIVETIYKTDFSREPNFSWDTILPGDFFDLIPQNIVIDKEGIAHKIDCEWNISGGIELKFLTFRALNSLADIWLRMPNNVTFPEDTKISFVTCISRDIGCPIDTVAYLQMREKEAILQAHVTGLPKERFLHQVLARPSGAENNKTATAKLEQAILERDAAIEENRALRSSFSWRAMAPWRLLRRLTSRDRAVAKAALRHVGQLIYLRAPAWVQTWIRSTSLLPDAVSGNTHPSLQAIVAARCAMTLGPVTADPITARLSQSTTLDISVVTYNSSKWLDGFTTSLLALDYSKQDLNVFFVDNGSTDGTVEALADVAERLRAAGMSVQIFQCKNDGYGSGHDYAIRAGSAPFCLVTNVDLTFEPDALTRVVATALADASEVAAWELRQKPYEHPKFYDPVTGLTNWNSHACVLMRRSAYEDVGGYDRNIFMYGEDVELSYRLRDAGYLLKYCPQATVWHYSYEDFTKVKPLQYSGSTFANLYLRLKYGSKWNRVQIPFMALRLLAAPQPFAGARRATLRNLGKLLALMPTIKIASRQDRRDFAFYGWDYEVTRAGAAVAVGAIEADCPLVSVITRTVRGRESLLRQALLSVAHQTYPNIEHIVVEDGGDSMADIVAEVAATTGRTIRYSSLPKLGRSAAGNDGLAIAEGRWCLFLDDDDLLFADHVEVLVQALTANPEAVAAYSPAWQVATTYGSEQRNSYTEHTYSVPPTLSQPFERDRLLQYNYLAIQSVLFERELFVTRGGFDEDIDVLEDWILWNRYAQGAQFVYVPKVTSLFRIAASPELAQLRQDAFDAALSIARGRINVMVLGGKV